MIDSQSLPLLAMWTTGVLWITRRITGSAVYYTLYRQHSPLARAGPPCAGQPGTLAL